MMTPAWILDIFAVLTLVVSAVSAARLVAARPWRRGAVVTDTDVSHLLMGIAMAGMLVSSLTTLSSGAWEVIFGLLTVWFGYRVVRDARANGVRALAGGHCAPHLAHSAAMLYMFLGLAAPAAGGGSGMAGMGGSSGSAMRALEYPTLAFVFALILAGYTVWDLDRLSGRRYSLASVSVSLAGAAPAGVPAMAGAEPSAVAFAAAAAAVPAAVPAAAPAGPAVADGGSPRSGRPSARDLLLADGTTVGCRIAMGVSMAFMLLIMI
jgi:hypothetical protein